MATQSERLRALEVKVDGNGAPGVLERLRVVEIVIPTLVTHDQLKEAVEEILATLKEQKGTARWAFDMFMRLAPWVVIVLTLAKVI